jgi:dienelactone hydrolase
MQKMKPKSFLVRSNLFLSLVISLSTITITVAMAAKKAIDPAHDKSIITHAVEYKDTNLAHPALLEGAVAYDTKFKGLRPGVLVVHEWTGYGSYVQSRIEQLAELGYIAFAADIYGKGIRPKTPKEAGATASIYKNDRNFMRERVKLALEELKKLPNVDATKLAAIGYCFGGTCVLELARSGAKMNGFVSFHGGLDTPRADDAKNIQGRVLVLHGADDPNVPQKEVKAFEKEMTNAKVNYQVIQYPGAVHGFTNPEHGNDNSTGVAYNAEADHKSWAEMKKFFAEIF